MKRVSPFIVAATLLALVVGLTAVQLHFIRLPNVEPTTRVTVFVLLTLNIIALLTLVFFVGKNLFRLMIERQQRIPGYRFRTRLVAIFVILLLIPSIFLFVTASGLANNYFNQIFSPQIKEPMQQSIDLARAFYDLERERMLAAARSASKGTALHAPWITVRHLELPQPEMSGMLRDAFDGREGAEIVSQPSGDLVRAAVPTGGGIVIAETKVPASLAEKSERLRSLHEEHLKIAELKKPVKMTYTLILGFVTLLIVFSGLWVSLKISKGITTPIQGLAIATELVAQGDLDVRVEEKSRDEIGMLIDSFNAMVAQLKENKRSLEESYLVSDRRRLYLENILENITSGVIFLDPQGTIVTINRAASAILALPAESVTGRNYNDLTARLHSEDLARMVADIEGTQLRDITREVKVHVGGRPLTIRVTIMGIRESEKASALGMLVVLDDLTEVIKAQKAGAWQEVARRIAHEIKNPLTPIKLSTERLIKKWQQKDEDFGQVFEKSTRTIIAEVDSLRNLVDIFSKYGKMPELTKAPTAVAEVIETVVSLYRGYKDVSIASEFGEGIPQIQLDREQFKRALINIFDNAIKAMKNSGSVSVTVRHTESGAAIDIADTGPGIPDDEKEKLFLPYFSKRKDGTGLGLAIASKIVTDHGGRIIVRDNTPQGSIFTIEIPKG